MQIAKAVVVGHPRAGRGRVRVLADNALGADGIGSLAVAVVAVYAVWRVLNRG